MRDLLHRLVGDALHLLAPSLCPACDAPLERTEQHYCDACRATFEPAPFPRDLYIELIEHFGRDELAISSMLSLFTFERESPVRRLVHALKYGGCFDLGVRMGRDIATAMKMFPEFDEAEIVVPVPLHRARRRERGYNQAEAIARGIAMELQLEVMPGALARRRHTISQTTLGSHGRLSNVRQAFRVAEDAVRERIVLLCDDVCTTGATLNACAETLLADGARKVMAATFAKDMLGVSAPMGVGR